MEDFQSDKDLETFAHGNTLDAQKAAERLWGRGQKVVANYLRSRGCSDPDDLVQEVFRKVWERRASFEPRGTGAWIKFLLQIAHRDLIDWARREKRTVTIIEDWDVPDEDWDIFTILADADEAEFLWRAADIHWLGLAIDRQTRPHILAAQYYLMGEDPREISALVRAVFPSFNIDLDLTLRDERMLRAAVFFVLYSSNDDLAAYLLSPSAPLSQSRLDELMTCVQKSREIAPPSGWTWDEVYILLLRFRLGFLNEKIAQTIPGVEVREIEATVAKCLELFPFRSKTLKLERGLGEIGQGNRMTDAGLWRRLVFEYRVFDQLPHKQILERTIPAADVVGESMTEARLNGWLSSGRIYTELAKFIRNGGLAA